MVAYEIQQQQFFQSANVLNRPIHSIFPNIGNENVITDFGRARDLFRYG